MPRRALGFGGRQEVNTAMWRRHMAEGTDDQSWQASPNCLGVDPDLFFPERGASTREAKEVCRGCIVREDCLEFAITNGEKFGIWGGLSERERRRIRRARGPARPGGAGFASGAPGGRAGAARPRGH